MPTCGGVGLILTGERVTSSTGNEEKEEGGWFLMGGIGKWRQFMPEPPILSIKEEERCSL